jgi:hypothetical protein
MSTLKECEYDHKTTVEIAEEANVAVKMKKAKTKKAKTKRAKKVQDFSRSLELLDTKTGHRHCRCCGSMGPSLAQKRLNDIPTDWVCKTCRAVCKAHNGVKCRLSKHRKTSHPYDYLVASLKDILPGHLHVQPGAVDIILAYITEPVPTPSLRCACCEFNYPVFTFSDSQFKKNGSKCQPCAKHYKNGLHRKEVCPASVGYWNRWLPEAVAYGEKWCTVSGGCTVIK